MINFQIMWWCHRVIGDLLFDIHGGLNDVSVCIGVGHAREVYGRHDTCKIYMGRYNIERHMKSFQVMSFNFCICNSKT
jgi:hypothetical protein